MTVAEQEQLRSRLEALTNAQLLQVWELLGIKLTEGSPRQEYLELDQEWIIGPIFADADYASAKQALNRVVAGEFSS